MSAYAPNFPPLVGGVSYGIPLQETVTTLIASGATARVVVPVRPGFEKAVAYLKTVMLHESAGKAWWF